MANAQLLTCFDFSITIYCQTTLCLECADDSASSHSPISSFVSFNTPPRSHIPLHSHPLSPYSSPICITSIILVSQLPSSLSLKLYFLPLLFKLSLPSTFLFGVFPPPFSLSHFAKGKKKTVHVVMSDQEIQIPLAYQHSLTFSWVWIAPLPLVFLPQPLSHILLGALCSSIPFYLLALFL